MNTFTFQSPSVLMLLLAVPLVAALVLYGFRKRNEILRLLRGTLWEKVVIYRYLMVLLAGLLLLIAALARPGWGVRKEPLTKKGRDVIFVLDVSRSMLAEDRVPNRIENAKRAILDCVESFEGNRVGLLAFGGSASIRAPLSTDYVFFRKMIEELSADSVDQGGTRIGDALRKVSDKLLSDEMQGYHDVVLLTDGGDQESQPAEAVELLNEKKASLLVIGFGAEGQGVRIPVVNDVTGQKTFMLYENREVWTQQESAELEALALQSDNGLFLNATTRALDLFDVYSRFVEHSEQQLIEGTNREKVDEKFQWFLVPAFFLLLAAGMLSADHRAMAAVALFLFSANVSDASSYAEGERLYGLKRYAEAMVAYEQASLEMKAIARRSDALFRAGNASFHLASGAEITEVESMEWFLTATRYYRAALDLEASHEDAGFNLELARHRWEELQKALEDENQENQDGEQQGDEQQSDQGDEDGEESGDDNDYSDEEEFDGESENYSDQSSETSMTDLANQDVPPPNISPQDLLSEEISNNEIREKKRSGKKTEVKKDW